MALPHCCLRRLRRGAGGRFIEDKKVDAVLGGQAFDQPEF